MRSSRACAVALVVASGALFGGPCDFADPAGDAVESGDDSGRVTSFLDELFARLPDSDVVLTTVSAAQDGPADALVNFGYDGAQGHYTAYLRGNAESLNGLLLRDDAGYLLQQDFIENGRRIRFASGDAITLLAAQGGLQLVLELAATEPASRIVFLIPADRDEVILDEEASSIGDAANPNYGEIGLLAKSKSPLFEGRHPVCDQIQQVVTQTIEKVCKILGGPIDDLETKAAQICTKLGDYITEALENSGLDEKTVERVKAGKSFLCRGVEIVVSKGKYLSRLKPSDWACLTFQVGQEISIVVSGKTIGDIICDKLYPPCGPGTVEDPVTHECVPSGSIIPNDPPDPPDPPHECPAGQTWDGHNCLCPNGYPVDRNGNCCPEGMYPDPNNGGECGCVDGGPPDPVTGQCTCPEGQTRDPATGKCSDCPDGKFPGGPVCDSEDPDCCVTCDEALAAVMGWQTRIEQETNRQFGVAGQLATCRLVSPTLCAGLEAEVAAIQVTIDTLLADTYAVYGAMVQQHCPQIPAIP